MPLSIAQAMTMRASTLSCFCAFIAALQAFVLSQAEVATGLFAVRRTFHGDQVGTANQTRTAFFATASGYVGKKPGVGFTVPQSAIKNTTGYDQCQLGVNCRPGYPRSRAWYSYWNLLGSFRPSNPYAAMTATTVFFPTTMGNTDPPRWTGDPVTPTTRFDGRYDFDRGGSIMVTPGPNRFGGTMQFFYGPNQRYYRWDLLSSPYITKAYGYGQPPISTFHKSQIGEIVTGRRMNHYWMTTQGYYRVTTFPDGDYIYSELQYLSTIVPFTTGMITGYQRFHQTTTIHTLTGYDNRTPAGLEGIISLVRPRLVHVYAIPDDPSDAIALRSSELSSWRINFLFLPEPSNAAMVTTGLTALAGLCRWRSRGCVGNRAAEDACGGEDAELC